MGKESLVFYKRLANSLAEQRNQEYSATANWERSRLSFCLIRSCLLCLRGSRSVFAKHVSEEVIEVERAVVEALPRRIKKKKNLNQNILFIINYVIISYGN